MFKRGNKFGAKKVSLDGLTFDSIKESKVYSELKLREKAGEIQKLEVHPRWKLTVDGYHICDYVGDFSFFEVENGRAERFRVVDVKSPVTARLPEFRLKKKLMAAIYKIEVEVWDGKRYS